MHEVPQMQDVLDVAAWFGTALGFLTVAILWMFRVIRSVKSGLERVVSQTENSHDGSMYPNLRDELTATRETIEGVAKTNELIVQRLERLQDDQAELRREVTEDRSAIRAEVEGVRRDMRNMNRSRDASVR